MKSQGMVVNLMYPASSSTEHGCRRWFDAELLEPP